MKIIGQVASAASSAQSFACFSEKFWIYFCRYAEESLAIEFIRTNIKLISSQHWIVICGSFRNYELFNLFPTRMYKPQWIQVLLNYPDNALNYPDNVINSHRYCKLLDEKLGIFDMKDAEDIGILRDIINCAILPIDFCLRKEFSQFFSGSIYYPQPLFYNKIYYTKESMEYLESVITIDNIEPILQQSKISNSFFERPSIAKIVKSKNLRFFMEYFDHKFLATHYADQYYNMNVQDVSKSYIRSIPWLETYVEKFNDEDWRVIAENVSIPNLHKNLWVVLLT